MSLAEMVTSSPGLTRFLMSHARPSMFEHRGPAFVRRVLRAAIEHTVAYPAFLIAHGFDPAEATWERFAELPLTSKHDYVDRYPLRERVVDGRLCGAYVIERSSGLGGGCYYWPRLREQDEEFIPQVDMGMRMYFGIDRIPTLLLSTFALGTWTAGVKLAYTLRRVAASGYPVTVITPGVDLEETLRIIQDLSPEYGQTILFGYPPFLKTVVDEGAARGLRWERYNVRLGTGGEGFPEEWRERMLERLGHDPERDLLSVVSGYGAADFGGTDVGRENPFSVLVRRLCLHDAGLCRDIFGEDTPPSLFQFDPGAAFVEQIDERLVVTVSGAVPLVRYDILDAGGTIPFDAVIGALHDHDLDPVGLMEIRGFSAADIFPMPFVYVHGRVDGTVTVGGANVYAQDITGVLAAAGDVDILGHKLGMRDERFVILLEHRDPQLKKSEAATLAKKYHRLMVEGLLRVNSEYRDQYNGNRRVADPLVEVYPAGGGPFGDDVGRLKRRYTVEGHPAAA